MKTALAVPEKPLADAAPAVLSSATLEQRQGRQPLRQAGLSRFAGNTRPAMAFTLP
jgi:hypothetical protein